MIQSQKPITNITMKVESDKLTVGYYLSINKRVGIVKRRQIRILGVAYRRMVSD